METVGDRLKSFYEGKNLSQESFAESIKASQQYISAVVNNKRELGKNILKRIAEAYPELDIIKLQYGERDIKKHSANEETPFYKQLSDKKNGDTLKPVPVYDIEFTLGFRELIRDERVAQIGNLSIPEVIGCDYVIKARGDSMADYINDRDWIGIKQVYDFEMIAFSHPYAVVTKEFQIVKYLSQSKKGDKFWSLKSHNKQYEDYDIPIDKVNELYIVRAILPFSKIKSVI